MRLVVFGLSLSSSWGNGHATTYRGLLKAYASRGHSVVFFERDVPWYAGNRDLPKPGFCDLRLYGSLDELDAFAHEIEQADAVIVGSYVPEGTALITKLRALELPVLAFYDIDTPVTLAKLQSDDREYLAREQVPLFDTYFTFSGGPIMQVLARDFGARNLRLLGCSADMETYRPLGSRPVYDLGYLGTYDPSRQPALEELLIAPARQLPNMRFVVAGPQYPDSIEWPGNITRLSHVPPGEHAAFYSGLRFALNVTRADMVRAGFSPSVRMFEAAACGAPVITDEWAGLDLFFEPGRDVLVASSTSDVIGFLQDSGAVAATVGAAGRARVVREHSAKVRAEQLEDHLRALMPRAVLHRPASAFV